MKLLNGNILLEYKNTGQGTLIEYALDVPFFMPEECTVFYKKQVIEFNHDNVRYVVVHHEDVIMVD